MTSAQVIESLIKGEITDKDAVAGLVRLGASKEDAEYQVRSLARVDVRLS